LRVEAEGFGVCVCWMGAQLEIWNPNLDSGTTVGRASFASARLRGLSQGIGIEGSGSRVKGWRAGHLLST